MFVTAAAIAALAVSPALAQRPRPGAGSGAGISGLTLLGNKSVQEELKLTDDQVKKVTDLAKKQGTARQALRELEGEERAKKMQEMAKEGDKMVAEILKPEQAKRLKQIQLQQQGSQAFNNPEVAKELKFTDEQKSKLREIQQDAEKQRAALRQPGGGGDRTEAFKKMSEINKATTEKAMALLTPEQQATWKTLAGEPFKGEIRLFQGGGGRPGGRPGAPPPNRS
jgi:Spy/CpxP family protein refolding chaperone